MIEQTSKGLRVILLIYAIVLVLSGLFHIFGTQTVVEKDQAIERILGGAMLAFALGAFLAYKEKLWNRIKIVVLVLIAWMILYTVTLAWGVLSGGLLKEAWGATIIGAVNTILITSFYFRERKLRR